MSNYLLWYIITRPAVCFSYLLRAGEENETKYSDPSRKYTSEVDGLAGMLASCLFIISLEIFCLVSNKTLLS